MPNNRVFYAVKAVGFRSNTDTGTSFKRVHGLQQCGLSVNFSLDATQQLGNIDVYAQVEATPEVELTLEKVLDGWPLLLDYATMTGTNSTISTNRSLVARSSNIVDALIVVADDTAGTVNVTGASDPTFSSQCLVSGAYLSQVSYKFPLDGKFSESVSLVSNTRVFSTGQTFTLTALRTAPNFVAGNTGTIGSGAYQVLRRHHLDTGNSRFPLNLPGIGTSGFLQAADANSFRTHLADFSISATLGRESLNEQGRKNPYFRFVKFPLEVTSEFQVTLGSSLAAANIPADFVNATEGGLDGSGNNLSPQTIIIRLEDGSRFDLGNQNYLTSATTNGANTDGGNDVATYSYRNFNFLTVSGSTAV